MRCSLCAQECEFVKSRDVADFFENRHADVLRAIDALISEAPEAERNFAQCSIPHENGRSYRAFDMNRDGFTLLAMGFTGAEALKWKLKYIEDFNRMEAELADTYRPPRATWSVAATSISPGGLIFALYLLGALSRSCGRSLEVQSWGATIMEAAYRQLDWPNRAVVE